MAKGNDRFKLTFGKYIEKGEVGASQTRSTALGRTKMWSEMERLVQWLRKEDLGPFEAIEFSLNDLPAEDKAELGIKGDLTKLAAEEKYNLIQRFNMRMRNELQKFNIDKKVEIRKMPAKNAIAVVGREV